jgi:hypothetical protein
MMARGATLHPRIARLVRNLLAPRLLRLPRVRDAVAGSFAGTELRYAHTHTEDRVVGTRATEIPLRQEKLTHLQRSVGFVLIREHGRTSPGSLRPSGPTPDRRFWFGPTATSRGRERHPTATT